MQEVKNMRKTKLTQLLDRDCLRLCRSFWLLDPVLHLDVSGPVIFILAFVSVFDCNTNFGRCCAFLLRFKHPDIFHFYAVLLKETFDLNVSGFVTETRYKKIPIILAAWGNTFKKTSFFLANERTQTFLLMNSITL